MVAVRNSNGLTDDLAGLASALESLDLRGGTHLGVEMSLRDRLATTIRSYLLPRLENPDRPLLVALVGPTGAGKSTLINSLSGTEVATTGHLRPTTTIPLVLTADPESVAIGNVDAQVVAGKAPILGEMTLVDTPDLDSTATHHRIVAETVMDHADVVVFVTSALRYADSVPWEVLRRAKYRGAVVIPVLNRVGPDSGAAVNDFRRRLGDAGLDDDPVRIPEHFIGAGTGRVHTIAVRELRRRLYWVARDRREHQRAVVNRVLNSTTEQIRRLITDVTAMAAELDLIEAEMTSGIAAEAALAPRRRPWAAFPLPAVPSGRWKVRRWLHRSQPNPAELEAWENAVRAGVVAEAETRLLTAVTVYGAPVTSQNPRGVAAAVKDIRGLLNEAVEGWISAVHEQARPHPRLSAPLLISGALTQIDAATTATVLGSDHVRQIAGQREALNTRLVVVFEHMGQRLAELWRQSVGDPTVEDLAGRLARVAAAYQFADA